jgi:Ca2+-binding EF-hand superfamily protein
MMERFLEKDFTFEVMEVMDSNNDGKVDINEFVESMILEMGRISYSELAKIKLRFQQLDVEGKGYLELNPMVDC